jgi:hypothetical protein
MNSTYVFTHFLNLSHSSSASGFLLASQGGFFGVGITCGGTYSLSSEKGVSPVGSWLSSIAFALQTLKLGDLRNSNTKDVLQNLR